MSRATQAVSRGSSGSECGRADAETARAEDSVGGLSARPSDTIEAARQSFLDAGGFDRIGRCRELFREQSQFLRTKAVALPFQRAQLRRFERHFLARWLARDHPATSQRLPDEPVVDTKRALDHVCSLRMSQFGHLVKQGQLGCAQDGLHSSHTLITLTLYSYYTPICSNPDKYVETVIRREPRSRRTGRIMWSQPDTRLTPRATLHSIQNTIWSRVSTSYLRTNSSF